MMIAVKNSPESCHARLRGVLEIYEQGNTAYRLKFQLKRPFKLWLVCL
jgi:hypothetical protein